MSMGKAEEQREQASDAREGSKQGAAGRFLQGRANALWPRELEKEPAAEQSRGDPAVPQSAGVPEPQLLLCGDRGAVPTLESD